MSAISAGQRIRGQDRPDVAWRIDTTSITQITSTTYITGSPVVDCTFTAPTSGRVWLIVGGGFEDNGGTNTVFIAPEVYLGTSAAGTLVLAADADTRGIESVGGNLGGVPGGPNNHYYTRVTMLSGLTPGATYYARLMYRVSGGSSADVPARDLAVIPG